MSAVSIKQLLEAGVHFGHQTRRWNPKMAKYIFGERNGIYIIDLEKTEALLDAACEFLTQTVAGGGYVLFVGTKKQAQQTILEEAVRCEMFYVNQRWLGGTLTNFETIRKSVKRLNELEKMQTDGTFERLTKKEVSLLKKEIAKLDKNLSGVRKMVRLPEALFVVDIKKEITAVYEARRLGIPVVALVDTNSDPDLVDYIIPGNDDAIKSIKLITQAAAEASLAGLNSLKQSEAVLKRQTQEAAARKASADMPEEAELVEEGTQKAAAPVRKPAAKRKKEPRESS